MDLLNYLPTIANFPKPGIFFRDISPLLANADAFQYSIESLDKLSREFDYTHILGIESRGFIFGAALAKQAHKGLLLARKPNKLPLASHTESYGLEYGKDALQVQAQTIESGAKILIIDDVLATGGTLVAASLLVKNVGATLSGAITLAQIRALNGKNLLSASGIRFRSLLTL
jgi:adenine phosphoribosyltransferase